MDAEETEMEHENKDVTIVGHTESPSAGENIDVTRKMPNASKQAVMIRRSLPTALSGNRLHINPGHPSIMNALRLLKRKEQIKRGPKEKESFRRTMYCLPDKYAKLPKFSSSDLTEKKLVQEHQDIGFGYPAQDYIDSFPRKTELSLSYTGVEFDKYISEVLYPNLAGKRFDLYKIDKQRRLIRLSQHSPRDIKDSKYQGSLIIIPYENDEDRPPQVLYRCGEDYFIQVSSTTSPQDQIPLIGTPPELPRPISEGSADNQQAAIPSSSTQNPIISPKRHLSTPSPVHVQQVVLDLTNTVIKHEPVDVRPKHETVSSMDTIPAPDIPGKCKIFDVSKFLRMRIEDKIIVHIRKNHIVPDVVRLYKKNPTFMQKDFTVCFTDHNNDLNTSGHMSVSPFALFVQFWKDVFQKHFVGNQESVPVIDLSTETEFYGILGNILYHGLILLDYWPVKLSQACACVLIMNNCSDRQLMTSLHRTMSDQERSVIADAKREIRSGSSQFTLQTTKTLCQVLRFYGNTQKPTPANLENLLLRVSKYYLIQKPFWALIEMRRGLQSVVADFLAHLDERDVFTFYSLLTPNALSLFEKTIYMFSSTGNSINEMEEKRVKMYLENFVMKLNCETLSTLLVKWCYSDCLCMDHLYVRFLSECVSERPQFCPDESTLNLSSVYSSQEELHQLMMAELET